MTDVMVCDSEYDLSTQRRHIDALARKGTAGLVLSVIPTLILALIAQRYLVEGLSLGAVKG